MHKKQRQATEAIQVRNASLKDKSRQQREVMLVVMVVMVLECGYGRRRSPRCSKRSGILCEKVGRNR